MRTGSAATFPQILDLLEHYGLLLVSDPHLPSVVRLVAGEPVRRSWWGHPRGHEMYAILNQLAAREEVLVSKLVSGKETYVHQRLWSALLGVGTARESWQLQDLSEPANFLLETLSHEQALRIDQIHQSTGFPAKALAEAAREVERKLLAYGEELHTASGAHTKRLESWEHWMQRVGFAGLLLAPEEGKEALEDALLLLNRQFEARGRLPWLATVP
jgi:hypothetical protein